ncbi:Lipopolysaccharide heptosyltransferase I [hydrothermal vent metagenome]|uniref:Lipopolysaccharide heptosyltransferase 1 n=1 Tax=hydrothermal vent metagenome TaxID=652676 RepID=A0A1W1BMU3_9ZZZZ
MKIAIVKLSAMGDIIHAMVALQFVKKAMPEIEIDWIVEESLVDLLSHNPDIHEILPVNLKSLKKDKTQLISEIKKVKSYASRQYDVVIDAQGLIKSAVVSRMLGSSRGFDKDSTREGVASLLYDKSFNIPYEENVIYRNLKLICDSLNIPCERESLLDKKPFLFFDEMDSKKVEELLSRDKKNIIYILGSSWSSKVYPKEKFVELIDMMGENPLVVWGSREEYDSAEYISKNSSVTIVPKLTLGELKALISRADLVIGGDSGPTHMAWAMNRASITLFGPTPGWRNTIATEQNRVICSESEVNPLKLNRDDYSIQEIEPSEIAKIARELIYKRSKLPEAV